MTRVKTLFLRIHCVRLRMQWGNCLRNLSFQLLNGQYFWSLKFDLHTVIFDTQLTVTFELFLRRYLQKLKFLVIIIRLLLGDRSSNFILILLQFVRISARWCILETPHIVDSQPLEFVVLRALGSKLAQVEGVSF